MEPSTQSESRRVSVRDPVKTRRRILRAATELFASQGRDATGVDQIARRSGFNKRMIYHYFGNKQGLYLAVLESEYVRIRQFASDLVTQAPTRSELLDGLVEEYFQFLQQNPEFVSLLNWENSHGAEGLKQLDFGDMIKPLVDAISKSSLGQSSPGPEQRQRPKASEKGNDEVQATYIIMTILALCSYYFTNRHSLSVVFGLDLDQPDHMQRWLAHIKEVVRLGLSAT